MVVLVYRQRLGEIVRKVEDTRNMLNAELVLMDVVLKPMKPHVYAFRQLGGDGAMSKTDGKFVVAQDRGWWLGVAKVAEDATLFRGNFGGDKEAPIFGLLDRGTNYRDTVRAARDGGVDESGRVEAAEVVVGTTDAARFGSRQIRGIGEETQEHVRGPVDPASITVGGGVAK